MKLFKNLTRISTILLGFLISTGLHAEIITSKGTRSGNEVTFQLEAGTAHISTPDGNSVLVWGFGDATAGTPVQYPGPTLEVNEGDIVHIELFNTLDVATSIVFPGQSNISATAIDGALPGVEGLLADLEAAPVSDATNASIIRYTFTASHPGTFQYHSGTNADLQVEMGLLGAIIVRPSGYVKWTGSTNPNNPFAGNGRQRAYGHAQSRYHREYLFFMTEMDVRVHRKVEDGHAADVDSTIHFPVYWFLNGRAAPDTLLPANVDYLPHQPYNCFPRMHPGEKLLMRVIGGSRDFHPFHHHGNHARMIAKNGRVLTTSPDTPVPDLSFEHFTVQSAPGDTADSLFTWTGAGLGFDVYGNQPGDPILPGEHAPDHGKPLPVLLPEGLDLAFGGFWPGSPFLGNSGSLPPGEGGLNPNGGYTFMWHSHTEKELCNNDVFPGGLMSMLVIEHPDVEIVE